MFGQNPTVRSDAEIAVELNTAVPDSVLRAFLATLGIDTLSGLINWTSNISAAELGITDATGLEYAQSTTYIRVFRESLTKAPPISALVGLETLILSINSIEIAPRLLPLVNLTNCSLYSNQFPQSEIEQMIDELWVNRVALGANSCSIRLDGNPGSAAAEASRASKIADIELEGSSVTI